MFSVHLRSRHLFIFLWDVEWPTSISTNKKIINIKRRMSRKKIELWLKWKWRTDCNFHERWQTRHGYKVYGQCIVVFGLSWHINLILERIQAQKETEIPTSVLCGQYYAYCRCSLFNCWCCKISPIHIKRRKRKKHKTNIRIRTQSLTILQSVLFSPFLSHFVSALLSLLPLLLPLTEIAVDIVQLFFINLWFGWLS